MVKPNGNNGKRQSKPTATSKANGSKGLNGRTPRFTQPIGISNASGNTRAVNNSILRMSGSDFFSTLTVKKAPVNPAERVLLDLIVSPSTILGTRLAQIAPTWERYFFTKFNVRYVPAVPTTLACQLCAYVDTDPLDDPSTAATADQLVRQAVAHTGAQQWNFISAKVTPLPLRADKMLYYTGLNPQNARLAFQGRVFVIQITDPIDIAGAPIQGDTLTGGSIFIDWAIDFQTPQLSPEVVSNPFTTGLGSAFLDIPMYNTVSTSMGSVSGFVPGRAVIVTLEVSFSNFTGGPIINDFAPGAQALENYTLTNEPITYTFDRSEILSVPTLASKSVILCRADSTGVVEFETTNEHWTLDDISPTVDYMRIRVTGELSPNRFRTIVRKTLTNDHPAV